MAVCQTCKGERYRVHIATQDNPFEISPGEYLIAGKFEIPCGSCGGTGIESCCDGEDRWQQEKRCTCRDITYPDGRKTVGVNPTCPLHGKT
jgi:hypothetical protein